MSFENLFEEENYLQALEKVLREGETRETRNGRTISLFGVTICMDLTKGFPLLTSKKMYIRGIITELLWFLQGRTNARWLQEKGVHIWDGNSTRNFLDSRGLVDYPEGECGPIYGFQWRNFGGDWSPEEEGSGNVRRSTGGPGDQWLHCVELVRNDPTSRRIFMSAWNPLQLDAMALPPCHVSYQFYVSSATNQVSCSMYQRSGDMFLGIPFNIASTALMVHIMAKLTGRQVGKIMLTIGDAHIYESHIQAVEMQLSLRNALFPFPRLELAEDFPDTVEELTPNLFHIVDYQCNSAIKVAMVV